MSLARQHISWTDVGRMVRTLLGQLPRDYDNILVITRGGMVPACLISERTGVRNILCAAVVFYEGSSQKYEKPMFVQFPDDAHIKGRRILVIDDVWDSGSTVVAVRNRLRAAGADATVCVLHWQPTNS